MAECEQEVPQQEALLLEFPGIVTDPEAVLGSFGGQAAVSQVLGGTRDALHLKLRPKDPLAQPMLGLKQPTHGLLLRLSRKADDGLHDDMGGVRAEVIAQVKSSVRFRGMADFQYVSCDTRPQAKQVPQAAGPSGFEPEPLMCPPQLFSKQDVPQDYAFRSYYGSDPDSFKAGAAMGRGTGRMAAHVINFQGLHVPQPLQQSGAAGPAAEVGLQLSKRQMLRAAAGLFADKTVRSQLEVQDSVPGMTSQDADIILPKLAYIFRSGPWKGLWVKRGYDPRTDPAAARRQAVEVPRRTQMLSSNPSTAKVTYQDVCRLLALPGDSSIAVPLEDFVEQEVASQLDKAVHLPACTLETGWFAKDDADRVSLIMAKSLQRLQAQTRPLEHARGAQPLHGPAPGTSAPDQPQDVQQPSSGAGLPAPAAAAQQLPLPPASRDPDDTSMEEADNGNQQPVGSAARGIPASAPGAPSESGKHISQQRVLPEDYLQGMLEDFHGNATASGLSAAAAQTLRNTAREDFETFEASEVDEGHEKDDRASDEGAYSGEDDHMDG